MADEVEYDEAKQAWCDSTADLLRPTGVDDPESVAEALFHAGLAPVPAVPSEALTAEEQSSVHRAEGWRSTLLPQSPSAQFLDQLLAIIRRLSASVPAVGPGEVPRGWKVEWRWERGPTTEEVEAGTFEPRSVPRLVPVAPPVDPEATT